jgi:hypothetical protein
MHIRAGLDALQYKSFGLPGIETRSLGRPFSSLVIVYREYSDRVVRLT